MSSLQETLRDANRENNRVPRKQSLPTPEPKHDAVSVSLKTLPVRSEKVSARRPLLISHVDNIAAVPVVEVAPPVPPPAAPPVVHAAPPPVKKKNQWKTGGGDKAVPPPKTPKKRSPKKVSTEVTPPPCASDEERSTDDVSNFVSTKHVQQ